MNKSNLLHLNLISRHEAHTATAMATHGACSLGSYTDQLLLSSRSAKYTNRAIYTRYSETIAICSKGYFSPILCIHALKMIKICFGSYRSSKG